MADGTRAGRARRLRLVALLVLLWSCEYGVPRYVGSTAARSTTLAAAPDGGLQALNLDAGADAADAAPATTGARDGAVPALTPPVAEPSPRPAHPGADRELEAKIDDNLRRDPLVPRGSVAVDVRDGVATVRGTVPNWQAYQAALDDVADAQPFQVVDELRVADRD